MKRNLLKILLIGLILEAPIITGTGAYYYKSSTIEDSTVTSEEIKIEPSATIIASDDGKSVSIAVSHLEGYTKLTYQLTYQSAGIIKGVESTIQLKDEQSFIKSGLFMGTCSSNICTSDQDVSHIWLTVILTDKSGKNKTITAGS